MKCIIFRMGSFERKMRIDDRRVHVPYAKQQSGTRDIYRGDNRSAWKGEKKRKNEEKSWETLPDEDGSHGDATPGTRNGLAFLTQYRAAIHSRSLRAQPYHHLLSLQALLSSPPFLRCLLVLLYSYWNGKSRAYTFFSCRPLLCTYEWNTNSLNLKKRKEPARPCYRSITRCIAIRCLAN